MLNADILCVESSELITNVTKLNPINWLVKDSDEGGKEADPARKDKIFEALKNFMEKSVGMVHIRIALPDGAAGNHFKAGRIELYDHNVEFNEHILKFPEATVDINSSLLSQCGLFDKQTASDLQERFFKSGKIYFFCSVFIMKGKL